MIKIKFLLIFVFIAISFVVLPCLVFAQENGLYKFIGENRKYGFMDKTGKVVIPAKYVRVWYPGFNNGFAFVSEKKTSNGDFFWICIDTSGRKKIRIGQRYNPTENLSERYYKKTRRRESDNFLKLNTDSLDSLPKIMYRNERIFYEGLASIQKDSLFGFINIENEMVIEPIFKEVRHFSEGLAGATLDGKKWGFINTESQFVIEPQYYLVDVFENGICGVLLTDEPFYIGDYHLNAIINKNNEILFRGEMHSYMGFKGELIQYYDMGDFRGKIHYLDKNGNMIIPNEKKR